jgi:DNA repair protein RecO (recombination protein O)
MIFKTKGIVLNYIRYRETSIICKIFTEQFGIQSYIVNSVRSNNSKTKIALFQPLTLLDLVVYHKPNGSLQRISELKCIYPFKSIPFEIKKSAVAIFMSEVLLKTMKEESSNPLLFNFLNESIQEFDKANSNYENFHLKFLINLSGFLGFLPSSSKDILAGKIIKPSTKEEEAFLDQIILSDFHSIIKTDNQMRRICLEFILDFYSSHVENFGEVNSVKVLKEVLTNK